MTGSECRACGHRPLRRFHRQEAVPTNSCLLLPDRDEAAAFPTGSIDLDFCGACGFIQNSAFQVELAEYSTRYEESQAFSAVFVDYARGVVDDWVSKYRLVGKRVVEIGCGKGEFLAMMVGAGVGSGIGIDPGVIPDRVVTEHPDRLTWVQTRFDEGYGPLDAQAVVCRHTMEHIPEVRRFLTTLRTAIGSSDTVVLFELPDTMRILEEAAFWDVYYEHCSYFTAGSLGRLFERCGFEILDIRHAYHDQYLLLEARPATAAPPSRSVDDVERVEKGVDQFESAYHDVVRQWRSRLAEVAGAGGSTVIWGASSKGVAFLNAVGEGVVAAVDINPNKHGMHIAGTGHKIIAPDALPEIEPDLVVAMNPLYLGEITDLLRSVGVDAELTAV